MMTLVGLSILIMSALVFVVCITIPNAHKQETIEMLVILKNCKTDTEFINYLKRNKRQFRMFKKFCKKRPDLQRLLYKKWREK